MRMRDRLYLLLLNLGFIVPSDKALAEVAERYRSAKAEIDEGHRVGYRPPDAPGLETAVRVKTEVTRPGARPIPYLPPGQQIEPPRILAESPRIIDHIAPPTTVWTHYSFDTPSRSFLAQDKVILSTSGSSLTRSVDPEASLHITWCATGQSPYEVPSVDWGKLTADSLKIGPSIRPPSDPQAFNTSLFTVPSGSLGQSKSRAGSLLDFESVPTFDFAELFGKSSPAISAAGSDRQPTSRPSGGEPVFSPNSVLYFGSTPTREVALIDRASDHRLNPSALGLDGFAWASAPPQDLYGLEYVGSSESLLAQTLLRRLAVIEASLDDHSRQLRRGLAPSFVGTTVLSPSLTRAEVLELIVEYVDPRLSSLAEKIEAELQALLRAASSSAKREQLRDSFLAILGDSLDLVPGLGPVARTIKLGRRALKLARLSGW